MLGGFDEHLGVDRFLLLAFVFLCAVVISLQFFVYQKLDFGLPGICFWFTKKVLLFFFLAGSFQYLAKNTYKQEVSDILRAFATDCGERTSVFWNELSAKSGLKLGTFLIDMHRGSDRPDHNK